MKSSKTIFEPDHVNPDQLISPAEAQRILAIGQTTYYQWVRKGWLHPIRFSARLVRIRAAEVRELIERSANGGEVL